jgi:CheY-like chemotaxis protein
MTPVLLVDDDADFRFLVRNALQDDPVDYSFYEVGSGEDALDFIRRLPPFEDRPRPALIYLDFELPGLSGLEVLQRLKSDDTTRDIPVVMLTALDGNAEKAAAARYGANSYFVKDADPASLIEAISRATEYWSKIHSRPRNS